MNVPTATTEPDPAAAPDASAASPPAPRRYGSRSERAWRAGLEVLRRDSTTRRSLAFADTLALAIALAAAAVVEGDSLLLPGLVALPVLIVVAKVMGLYDRDAALLRRSTLDEAPSLFHLSTLATLVLWLAGSAVVSGGLTAGGALVFWVTQFTLAATLRTLARALARGISPTERCLFVGDTASAVEFQSKLDAARGIKAAVVSVVPVDDAPPPDRSEEWTREQIGQIARVAEEHGVQRVVVAPGPGASEELVNSVRLVRDAGLKVSVLPRHSRIAGSAIAIDRLDGITLLGVQRFHVTRSSRALKRGFDIACSLAGLVLLSPLLAVIAIAIRADTPGPILFRQRRAGRKDEPFEMLKFRSMYDGADRDREGLETLNQAEGVFKLAGDPRVTRVGAILRRFSLDELPQLVNVLRGEMSMVGPRPLPLDEDRRIVGWKRRRLELRPGITGPWQLLGPTRVPLREMANLDNQYIADWSLWNDIRIMLLTVPHVVGRRGV
jgi:exopolysaccharide biosynthesis polyprenyl glycosylphosphotransferase